VSDYETSQRRRNIIVGIFVLVAMCVLAWLIYIFGELPTTVSKWDSFQVFAQFPTAPGVQKDTPVRLCGYQIGRVTKVMPPERRRDLNTGLEYHQAVVVLSIDKKYVNIPSNVDVKMMTRGLGSSYIELTVDPCEPPTPRDPNRPETKYLVNGMWLQGSTGMTSEFFPEESQKKLDGLVNSLTTLIANANDILGDQRNKDNLRTTLANLSTASGQAAKSLEEFQKFSASAVSASEQLGKTLSQLRLILEKVNNGDGTAGKFVNDGRLYEDLLDTTEQLQLLLQDLKSFVAEYRAKGIKIKL